MGYLSQDIEAVQMIADSAFGNLRMGVFETSGWYGIVEHDYQEVNSVRFKEKVSEEFSEDARVALVYVEEGSQVHYGCPWFEVASRFCEEEIAGVLVLERQCHWRTRSPLYAMTMTEYLEKIPSFVWERKMPVLFDESGLFSKFSPGSHKLDLDPRISFCDLDHAMENGVVFAENWECGIRPVFDITEETGSCRFAYLSAINELARAFDEFGGFLQSSVLNIDLSYSDPMEVLLTARKLFPGCVDDDIIALVKSEHPRIEWPCAVAFDGSRIPEYMALSEKIRVLGDISRVAKRSFSEHHLLFVIPDDSDEDAVDALKDALDVLGVTASIGAVQAGVPVEDIVV